MKDELHDTAMREFDQHGRYSEMGWKVWACIIGGGFLFYLLITAIRG